MAYFDYGLFLYYDNKFTDALQILKDGVELGNSRCNFVYYDLFLNFLDFEKNYLKLIDLSEILVQDILLGNVFSVFEFFFLRKILIKFYKVPIEKLNNENLNDLLEITSKSLTHKEMILQNFSGNIVFTELLLSHGFLNYIGANGKTDYQLAEKCLKQSLKNSGNNSYKRFCYSYIFKIRMRRLGFKKQKINGDIKGNYYDRDFSIGEIKKLFLVNNDYNRFNENIKDIYADKNNGIINVENKTNINEITQNHNFNITLNKKNSNEDVLDDIIDITINEDTKRVPYITKLQESLLEKKNLVYNSIPINIGDKINKTKDKLYKIYNDSQINGKLEDFSSSFFYYLGKIYENGWGTKIDEILSYCFFIHGRDAKIKNLGTGSVISYYRKYKSQIKIESKKYKNFIQKFDKIKNNIIINLEEKECFICYENDKNTILFPCRHSICFYLFIAIVCLV